MRIFAYFAQITAVALRIAIDPDHLERACVSQRRSRRAQNGCRRRHWIAAQLTL